MVWSSAESLEDGAPAFRGWTGLGISLQRRQEDDEAAAKNIDCSLPRGGVSEQPGWRLFLLKLGWKFTKDLIVKCLTFIGIIHTENKASKEPR